MFCGSELASWRKRIILILLTYFAIFSYSHTFFMLPPFLKKAGLEPQRIGWIISAFYLAATLCRPTAGWFIDRFGIRRTMVGASSICAVSALLLAFTDHTPGILYTIRLFMGGGFSVFVVSTTTYQSLVIPERIRGSAFAITSIGGVMTAFTIIPLAELFINRGWDLPYLLMASAASLWAMSMAFLLPPVQQDFSSNKTQKTSYAALFKETPIKFLLISCVFLGLTDASIAYVSSLAIGRGLNPSVYMVAISIGAIIIRLFGRGLYERVPRTVIAAPSFGAMGLALFGASFATSNFMIAFFGFLYGAAVGYGYPTHLALIGDMIPERFRGRASSMVYFSMDISWTLLPVYIGYASALAGISWAFRGFSLFAFGVSVLVYFFLWKRIGQKKGIHLH